jgi:hypothetical protein
VIALKVIDLTGDTPYEIVVVEVDGVLKQVHLFENVLLEDNEQYINEITTLTLLNRSDTIEKD